LGSVAARAKNIHDNRLTELLRSLYCAPLATPGATRRGKRDGREAELKSKVDGTSPRAILPAPFKARGDARLDEAPARRQINPPDPDAARCAL
jgi:hypothetical protein